MNIIEMICFGAVLMSVAASTTVQTKNGLVEGVTQYLSNCTPVDAFLGIPYAAPPTGNYRFLSPQPVVNWTGSLKANTLPPSCYQAVTEDMKKTEWYVSDSAESEDCLYLNIWKPSNVSKSLLPVMFWIYGGAFIAGSSNMPLYNGSILAAEENVIVVTFNYRLSMFAFLYLNCSSVMGNAGLQDQLLALQWVQDNIAAFGGDPSRVTIFGESSGGACVGYHLENSNAYKLFQNGIIESGPSNSNMGGFTEDQALNASLSLAHNVNCSSSLTDESQDILHCLQDKTPNQLLSSYRGLGLYLQVPFLPIKNGIEVPKNPSNSAEEIPPALRKDVIIGNIRREMVYFIDKFVPGKTLSENTSVSEDDLKGLIENVFQLTDILLQDLFIFVFRNFSTTNQTEYRVETAEIITDSIMICPSEALAKQFSSDNNHVYFYYFTHRPSTGSKVPIPEWAGTVHGDEIPFVFGHPLNPQEGYTSTEALISRSIMAYWASFARTGNPNFGSTNWPEVSADQETSYLEFNDHPTPVAKYGLKERECQFLNTIYPELLKIQEMLDTTKKR